MTARQVSLGGVGGGGVDSVIQDAGKSAVRVSVIQPAATFTNATPSSAAAGADTLLTSAGVHGLTSAVAIGVPIYVSGGTGWTVGFHTITAVAVDTTGTTVQIDTPYDAGMGIPTIALANTEVTLATVTLAAGVMGANGAVVIDPSFSCNDTSATNKIPRVRFGGTVYYAPTVTTTPNVHPAPITIQNRNATNSQVGSFATSAAAYSGNTATANPTSSVDTTAAVDITFTVQPAAANIVMRLERYTVFVHPGA